MRKKIWLHVFFWAFYSGVNSYLNYFWLKETAPVQDETDLVFRVIAGTCLYILPFVALAYYLVLLALNHIVQRKTGAFINIMIIAVPYAIAIVLAICIMRLVVFPYIFRFTTPQGIPFFVTQRILSIMIEAAFPAGFFIAHAYISKQLQAKEREQLLISEQLSAELQLLKNQLNPHFLFNTLNNIYALSVKKSDKTPEVVLKLSDLLSYTLYETGNETIPVAKEIQFLEDYILLQKIRYGTHLSVVFTKEIDHPAQPITPMLLLPLVENAFKHGAADNHFDSFIHIQFRLHNGFLLFTVENNFEAPAGSMNNLQIGLRNTKRLAELLYREQQLAISAREHVFSVNFQINLNSYGKN